MGFVGLVNNANPTMAAMKKEACSVTGKIIILCTGPTYYGVGPGMEKELSCNKTCSPRYTGTYEHYQFNCSVNGSGTLSSRSLS